MNQVTRIQGGIQKQPSRAPKHHSFPYLRVANVLRGRLDLSEVHNIELFGDELNVLWLQCGDLLIVEGNGSKNEIGRSALWNGAIKNAVHQNHIIRARLVAGEPQYLDYYWNSPDGSRRVGQVAGSTSGRRGGGADPGRVKARGAAAAEHPEAGLRRRARAPGPRRRAGQRAIGADTRGRERPCLGGRRGGGRATAAGVSGLRDAFHRAPSVPLRQRV